MHCETQCIATLNFTWGESEYAIHSCTRLVCDTLRRVALGPMTVRTVPAGNERASDGYRSGTSSAKHGAWHDKRSFCQAFPVTLGWVLNETAVLRTVSRRHAGQRISLCYVSKSCSMRAKEPHASSSPRTVFEAARGAGRLLGLAERHLQLASRYAQGRRFA
jgi:hypothetical protein